MPVHRHRYLVVVIALSCASVCASAALGQSPIGFEYRLQLGKAESEDETELFGGLQRVVVDREGRIFVADYPRIGVLVYGPDGSHIATIGTKGRGPGELNQVTSMAITPDGDLLVADGLNMRFTRFAVDGSVVAQHPIPELSNVSPTALDVFGDNYLMYYLPPTLSGRAEVLHVLSPDLSEIVESFGELDEIWHPYTDGQYAIAGSPRGARVVVWGDRTCASSYIYEGTIACYRRTSRGFDLQRLVGTPSESRAYKSFRKGDERPPGWVWSGSARNGRFAVSINTSSRGLAVTDTSLTHFTVRKIKGRDRLFAEVFDEDGVLVVSGVVDNYEPFPKGVPPLFQVLESTPDGNIYLTDVREGFPVLRVVRLKINKNHNSR